MGMIKFSIKFCTKFELPKWMMDDSDLLAVCYWGLDPTFWIHRKVFIKTVFDLKQWKSFKGFYESYSRVVSKVEIQGVIVSVDEKEKLVIYKVDDGTGIISCCCWRNTIKDSFTLGQSVTVQGKITEYRNQRQLTVNSIITASEENLNAECLFWLDVVNLTRSLYSTPYVPPESCVQAGQQTTTKLLLDLFQKWKSDGRLSFSFVELCSMPEVQRIKENQDEANDQQAAGGNELLREILSKLEKQGEIFYKDTKRDRYEIITHKHHLKPAIIKAITDICKGSLHDGVHISRITDVVHSAQNLSRVPCIHIVDCLKKLIEKSEVYQKSNDFYCLV